MKQLIQTQSAPAAIGSYSQAIAHNKTVYLSGQIPLDPISMELVKGALTYPTDNRQNGVDIRAKAGSNVHAIYDGKVIFANWLRGFGLLVIINHGNGFMSLYGRNHSLYTKVGDKVKARDVIASIGTGYNKSSLYFEIRRNGTSIDPSQWCRS